DEVERFGDGAGKVLHAAHSYAGILQYTASVAQKRSKPKALPIFAECRVRWARTSVDLSLSCEEHRQCRQWPRPGSRPAAGSRSDRPHGKTAGAEPLAPPASRPLAQGASGCSPCSGHGARASKGQDLTMLGPKFQPAPGDEPLPARGDYRFSSRMTARSTA